MDILVGSNKDEIDAISQFDEWAGALKRPLFTATLTSLARLCARAQGLQSQGFKYANMASALSRDEREHAESKSDGYVGIARSLIVLSRDEAAEYFDRAVEVASRVGDENLDRWAALLDLADRAATSERPLAEIAYKLARCAELTYEYVARDKHFDWEGTVRAITALCPSSSLAILSRWRDRAFGLPGRLLPIAVEFLLERRRIDPKIAVCLIGFRAQWDWVEPLSDALNACGSKAEKESVFAFAYGYMRLEEHEPSMWHRTREALASHGLSITDIDGLISFSQQRELSARRNSSDTEELLARMDDEKEQCNWNEIFCETDLLSANGILGAYNRLRQGPARYHEDRFFKEMFGRVPIGKEADLIRAVSQMSEFDLYCLHSFLRQLPKSWKSRLAVRSALATVIKSLCRKYYMNVTRSRYYQVLPLKAVYEISGVAEIEIADIVLSAIGEATQVVGAGRLFTLVGLLALKLSCDEALDALSFGLGLFDAVLEDRDGDGPWSQALAPAVDVDGAIAGYVWAGLASPRASVRWEAAHVVRRLCMLGQTSLLAALAVLAKAGGGGAFADARLHFYGLHARQWLVIALARAASESPEAVVPYADYLMELALCGDPHVLIREFAARAVLAMCEGSYLLIDPQIQQQLRNVNEPTLPVEVSRSYERLPQKLQSSEQSEGRHFLFGIDVGALLVCAAWALLCEDASRGRGRSRTGAHRMGAFGLRAVGR